MKFRLIEYVGVLLRFANSEPEDAWWRHHEAIEASRDHPRFHPQRVHRADEVAEVQRKVVDLLDQLVLMSEEKLGIPPPWVQFDTVSPNDRLTHAEWHAANQLQVLNSFREIEKAHPRAAALLATSLAGLMVDEFHSALIQLIQFVFYTPTRLLRCEWCGDFTVEDRVIRSPKAKRRKFCSDPCRRRGDYNRRKLSGYWRKYRGLGSNDKKESERTKLVRALLARRVWPSTEKGLLYQEALAKGEQTLEEILDAIGVSTSSD